MHDNTVPTILVLKTYTGLQILFSIDNYNNVKNPLDHCFLRPFKKVSPDSVYIHVRTV